MNYTNNVRCDQVKPLERKLFRYLCRQIDYNGVVHDQYVVNNIQEKLSFFKDKYGILLYSEMGRKRNMLL